MAELKVFDGSGRNVQMVSGELVERIKAMVYEYAGNSALPVSAAIGVLEIAKFEIMQEQQE